MCPAAVGVHQFCRVGPLAMVGGQAHISSDVPPFVTIDGQSSYVVGLNQVGLRRAGHGQDDPATEGRLPPHLPQRPDVDRDARRLQEEFTAGPAAEFIPSCPPPPAASSPAPHAARRDDQDPPGGRRIAATIPAQGRVKKRWLKTGDPDSSAIGVPQAQEALRVLSLDRRRHLPCSSP